MSLRLSRRPAVPWAWPDGSLHDAPPPPVALLYFIDAGTTPAHGYWLLTNQPSCAVEHVLDGAETVDGKTLRLRCDRRRGHPPERDCDAGHRAVIDRQGGVSHQWGDT
jgi:hypothetical protein